MLHDSAMIVRLSISQWTAKKFDKRVTEKVNSDFGASREAGRYNKSLVAKEAIADITKAVSAARAFHYENTLPWDDAGGRILPMDNYETYMSKMRSLHNDFDAAVREFVDNYGAYREEARAALNGMFRAEDYPSRSDIKRRYAWGVDIDPVPFSGDFRVNLQGKDAERIRKEIDERVREREAEAIKDLFGRIQKVVGHVVDKLSDPEAIFRDSLIDNVVELVQVLPKLNINDDKDLNRVTRDMEKKLIGLEPDNIRSDAKVRSKAASDAQAILDKMAGYAGA